MTLDELRTAVLAAIELHGEFAEVRWEDRSGKTWTPAVWVKPNNILSDDAPAMLISPDTGDTDGR